MVNDVDVDGITTETSNHITGGMIYDPNPFQVSFRFDTTVRFSKTLDWCNRQTYSPTRHYTHGYRFTMKIIANLYPWV